MQKFGVKIDMSSFFDDNRKFVMLLADMAWENVLALQNRVENVFDMESGSVRFLTNDGFFIPSQEPIEIIKMVEGIKAFIPNKSLEKRRSKKKKILREKPVEGEQNEAAENHSPPTPTVVDEMMIKKRKFYSLDAGLVSSTPNQPKRSRNNGVHTTIECESNVDKPNEITSTSNVQRLNNLTDQGVSIAQENVSQKFKRSHRKKVSADKTGGSDSLVNSKLTFKKDTNFSSQRSLEKSKSRKDAAEEKESTTHIHFDDSGDPVSTTTEHSLSDKLENPKAAKIIFRCSLDNMTRNKPRVLKIKTSSGSTPNDSHIEIQEQIIILPAEKNHEQDRQSNGVDDSKASFVPIGPVMLLAEAEVTQELNESTIQYNPASNEEEMSTNSEGKELGKSQASVIDLYGDGEDDIECTRNRNITSDFSDVIELNESEDDDKEASSLYNADRAENTPSKRKLRYSSIKKLLPSSRPLKDLPNCGNYVIFRMPLKTNKNKLTDYIVGRCEYTNKRTKIIKMVLIGGQPGVESDLSQYECNMDVSSDENFVMNIKLSDMVEPVVHIVEGEWKK